jgi:chromosome segregation ATPase
MISIKRSLDLLEQWELRYRSVLQCYLAALASIEAHVVEAERGLAEGLRGRLRQMRDNVGRDASVELLEAVRNDLDDRLSEFKALSNQVLKAREQDIRAILEAVADATAALAQQADYHASRFQSVARQLESAVQLDSLSLIREQVIEATSRLKRCTESMHSQGHAEAARLQDQLQRLQRRLEEAESLKACWKATSWRAGP